MKNNNPRFKQSQPDFSSQRIVWRYLFLDSLESFSLFNGLEKASKQTIFLEPKLKKKQQKNKKTNIINIS